MLSYPKIHHLTQRKNNVLKRKKRRAKSRGLFHSVGMASTFTISVDLDAFKKATTKFFTQRNIFWSEVRGVLAMMDEVHAAAYDKASESDDDKSSSESSDRSNDSDVDERTTEIERLKKKKMYNGTLDTSERSSLLTVINSILSSENYSKRYRINLYDALASLDSSLNFRHFLT